MRGKSFWLVLLGLVFLTGCFKHPTEAGPEAQADKLTVGKVQGEIKIGMPASDVAAILGSPNIVTTDEKRREVWIYDKVSSNRVDTSRAASGSLLFGGIGGPVGGLGTASGSSSQAQSTTTQKTLTIIIKYDENKKVRDLAYNYSQF
ncbi:MAG: hypothetical protein GWM98_13555 [Nitrospinaceae bacterium]|nr:hypothetical protein [Nitrospinaceae bacterium]NIR55310.1 hypothetical protein [Nitrospinaceae bacterium]NIS85749.1 hypothetical protein [Nitrospinaceae bacterium]NIT82599.1 hypothetical protein [Nitrospinaceae bacterium]NIU44804.1 hypothetical protein [Nitrospinaceae bacterium]